MALLGLSVLIIDYNGTGNSLKTGDISFSSMKGADTDGFTIKTLVNLPPKTEIRFTDSEWNGNHFGFDEHDILWKTGNNVILANSIIIFSDLNATPSVSMGTIYGSMKISKKKDAIFAYIGSKRMPLRILAACSNDELGFGTLLNTRLIRDRTALVFK